jgi:hypothetical protein
MNDYTFAVLPKKQMWVLQLPGGRRLMCKGTPFRDRRYSEFLYSIDKGKAARMLKPLLKKHGIYEEPVLMDCTESGFKFVEGDVQHMAKKISTLLQQLVDSYVKKDNFRSEIAKNLTA